MQRRLNTTTADVSAIRGALAEVGITARIRRFSNTIRVCLKADYQPIERTMADLALNMAGFGGPCGGGAVWDDYQACFYPVAA